MSDLDGVLQEALRDGREAQLKLGGGGYALEVNGQLLVDGIPCETFGQPLDRIRFDSASQQLVDDFLRLC